MTIDLCRWEGVGTLHPSGEMPPPDQDMLLHGTVCLDVTERWHASVMRVRAKAWLDLTTARLRYRLSVGGVPGWMNHRMRIAGVGPDYVGTLGSNNEVQVAGWRNNLKGMDGPSLTLMIYSSSLGSTLIEQLLARSLGSRG